MGHWHADAPYPLGLLRQSRERPSRDRSATKYFETRAFIATPVSRDSA